MNYTLLLLLLLTGLTNSFAQTETTVWNGKTYYVYPHQYELIDIRETFLTHALGTEVLKRDDNNQKVVDISVRMFSEEERAIWHDTRRMSRKEKEEEKLLVEMMEKKPDYFYYYSDEVEGDITPALTPIPDGDYVQYYRDLPYLDKGILRFKNDVVAGVFHIKNNQLDGDASWYSANGMLLKKGSFSNGSRHGNWVFHSYNAAYTDEYNYYNPHLSLHYVLNNPLQYDTVTEKITYNMGLRNGPYSFEQNGELHTSGFYKDDKESGSWDFYGFTVEYVEMYEDGNVVPYEDQFIIKPFIQKHYVIADKPQRGKGVILRDEAVAAEYLDESNSYWRENLFDSSLDLLLPNWFDDFDTYYTILTPENSEDNIELPEEGVNSYEGEEMIPESVYPEYLYGDYILRDSIDTNDYSQSGWQFINNKFYTRNQLIDSVGYLFKYEEYEERYGNGQLKFRFKTNNGTLVAEDSMFWENGFPANTITFDAEKHRYEQHFFDYSGKLYKTVLFDEKGETIHPPQKKTNETRDDETTVSDYVIIDGLPYYGASAFSPLYYSDREKLAKTPLTERTLILAERWNHDSSLCATAYLDPVTLTLEYTENNIMGSPYKKQTVQFGEEYRTANASTQHIIGDLRLETISSGTLPDFENPWYGSQLDKPLPQVYTLYWEGNYDLQSDDLLYYRDQPFSGSFSLSLSGKKYSYATSEDKIDIRLLSFNREAIKRDAALRRYLKTKKHDPFLESYTAAVYYGESAFSQLFPHCRKFISFGNFFYFDEYSDYSYYDEQNPATGIIYDGSVTGAYLNGKPHGEWLIKDDNQLVTARMNYEKGELEGELLYYATELPAPKYKRNENPENWYLYDPSKTYPEKKIRYVAVRETFHNGLLDGPYTTMNWKGEIQSYENYREGLKHGISYQRNPYFYSESQFENGLLDGISFTYLTMPERDSILLYELNFQDGALQGESKTYHTNGKLAKRGFFLGGQPIDDFEAYDTLGFKYQYVKFQYNQPVEEKIWEENQLSARYLFNWKDSIPFDISEITESSSFEKLASSYGIWNDSYDEPYYGRPSMVDKTGIDYHITKYYPNDTVARFGNISKGKKVGYWKHFSYEGKALYEITYFDTILVINDSVRFKSKGILTYLDDKGKPSSKSHIIEKVEKYDCSHTDHTEERMLYTFWEADTSQHRINGYVKNYYDNGAIQNEGYVVDGLATGTWKLYDSDGQLSQVGNYKQGKRDGRWLKGDLSNVKNMSEICLNPNLDNLDEIIAYQEKLLDISVVYYRMGKIIKSEYYGINRNTEDDPSGYYGEDEYGRW